MWKQSLCDHEAMNIRIKKKKSMLEIVEKGMGEAGTTFLLIEATKSTL